MMKKSWMFTGLAALTLTACGDVDPGAAVVSDNQALSYEEFRDSIYQEPRGGVFIVNGDEIIESEDELRDFHARVVQEGALIINRVQGADDAWDEATAHALTYCISRQSFGAQYDRVVQGMADATGAWEAVADVDFIHDSSKDDACDARTSGVVFDVRQVQSGQYLARAFFPSTSRRNRNVLIDTSTYAYDDDRSHPMTLAGILRHELGHTLGFRHEHTRPESGACFEDNSWRALTPYDSSSVMHYPQCNGANTWALELTQRDAQGAAAAYPEGGGDGGAGGGDGGECLPAGDACSDNADCCSNSCRRQRGQYVCR